MCPFLWVHAYRIADIRTWLYYWIFSLWGPIRGSFMLGRTWHYPINTQLIPNSNSISNKQCSCVGSNPVITWWLVSKDQQSIRCHDTVMMLCLWHLFDCFNEARHLNPQKVAGCWHGHFELGVSAHSLFPNHILTRLYWEPFWVWVELDRVCHHQRHHFW